MKQLKRESKKKRVTRLLRPYLGPRSGGSKPFFFSIIKYADLCLYFSLSFFSVEIKSSLQEKNEI